MIYFCSAVEDEDEEEDEMGDKGDEFGCGQLLMPFEQLLQNTGSQTTFNRWVTSAFPFK